MTDDVSGAGHHLSHILCSGYGHCPTVCRFLVFRKHFFFIEFPLHNSYPVVCSWMLSQTGTLIFALFQFYCSLRHSKRPLVCASACVRVCVCLVRIRERMTRRKSICVCKNAHSWRDSWRSDEGATLLMSFPSGHPVLSSGKGVKSWNF